MLAIKRSFRGEDGRRLSAPSKKPRAAPHYFNTMPQEMYDAVAARLPVRDYVNLVQATGRSSARRPVLFDIANEWTLPRGLYTKTKVFVECIDLDIDSTMRGHEEQYVLDVTDKEIHDKYGLHYVYIDADDNKDDEVEYYWQNSDDKTDSAHRVAFARACVEHFNRVQRVMDFTFSLYTLDKIKNYY
ncbi:ORF143 [Lymantria xylina nucleopolyhedrovirus]|uniref:ORF143 n=1 Tax=Lymantria xylina multiple nucleopolyhedrovirus TaxID=2847840 RepID=D4N2I0_9ABAC|nr:ORF143 [Lymantria xylina nucleopolyhedrovirus]ADD73852.1 ORF143 [Lymantria xylina nucleopolyhedrovirus]